MLLQIKLPGQQSSSQLIEHLFYKQYPHLRRLKLKSFRPLEQFAEVLDRDLDEAFEMVVRRKTLYALNWCDFILVHPDCIIDELEHLSKRLANKIRIKEKI